MMVAMMTVGVIVWWLPCDPACGLCSLLNIFELTSVLLSADFWKSSGHREPAARCRQNLAWASPLHKPGSAHEIIELLLRSMTKTIFSSFLSCPDRKKVEDTKSSMIGGPTILVNGAFTNYRRFPILHFLQSAQSKVHSVVGTSVRG